MIDGVPQTCPEMFNIPTCFQQGLGNHSSLVALDQQGPCQLHDKRIMCDLNDPTSSALHAMA